MYAHERSLVKKLQDKPFALLGVNSDKDLESIREIVKEKSLTWRSFWNGEEGTSGPISKRWDVSGWPTVYIMDAQGVIRFINPQRTEKGAEALDEAITTLLAEMGHDVDLSQEEDAEADAPEDDTKEGSGE